MARFKVGDVVRVRDDLTAHAHYDGGCIFCDEMTLWRGKAVTIVNVDDCGGLLRYQVKECTGYYFSESMFYDCVVKTAPAPEPEFKPGDYVKVEYRGKITTGPDRDGEYFVDGDGVGDYVNPRYITKQEAPPAPPKPKMCRIDRAFALPRHCLACPIPCRSLKWRAKYDPNRRPDDCPLVEVDDDTSGLLNPRRKGLAEVTD